MERDAQKGNLDDASRKLRALRDTDQTTHCSSSFDFVEPPEHVVNVGEIVCTLDDRVDLTLRRVVLLEMSLLSEDAHLSIRSRSQVSHHCFLWGGSTIQGPRTHLVKCLWRDGPSGL